MKKNKIKHNFWHRFGFVLGSVAGVQLLFQMIFFAILAFKPSEGLLTGIYFLINFPGIIVIFVLDLFGASISAESAGSFIFIVIFAFIFSTLVYSLVINGLLELKKNWKKN